MPTTADCPFPTALPSSLTLLVPLRYKPSLVSQVAFAARFQATAQSFESSVTSRDVTLSKDAVHARRLSA